MKSPFRKYLFTCKNCGKESACQLDAYSKKRLLQIHREPYLSQRCQICGHEANYHFDRLYSKPRYWPIILIWVVAIYASYSYGMGLYREFGSLDGYRSDDKIAAIAIAFIAPLALGGMLAIMFARSGNKFNNKASEFM